MHKTTLLFRAAALLLCLPACLAAEEAAPARKAIRLVLHWDHQSQFAGYYTALDKGFYEDEGLDLTIIRGGPDVRSCEVMNEGGAEFCSSMLSTALEKRQEGIPLVEIAQIVNRSNFELVAWKTPDPVKSTTVLHLDQLNRRRITVWEHDFRLPYETLFEKQDIEPVILPQYYTLSLFLNHGADACAVMNYNEYHWLLQHGVKEDDITVFPLWQHGVDMPEDGLYTSEMFLAENPELCAAFVRASLKGWEYARDNQDEALDSVMARVEEAKLPTNRPHMRWMLAKILESIFPAEGSRWTFGTLSQRQYESSCQMLGTRGKISDPPAFKDFVKDTEVQHVEP